MFKKDDKEPLASLPPSARIRFISEVLEREKQMRLRVLKGSNREEKVQEVDTCLEYLRHINTALAHCRMQLDGLKECCERHGLDMQSFSPAGAVIIELDKMKGIKTQ